MFLQWGRKLEEIMKKKNKKVSGVTSRLWS